MQVEKGKDTGARAGVRYDNSDPYSREQRLDRGELNNSQRKLQPLLPNHYDHHAPQRGRVSGYYYFHGIDIKFRGKRFPPKRIKRKRKRKMLSS